MILLRWALMAGKNEVITSAANPLLKAVRKAVARGGLTDGGLAVCESPTLVQEALDSPAAVECILIAERAVAANRRLLESGVTIRIVADKLFRDIASTERNQGALALVRLPAPRLEAVFDGDGPVVALDRITDPGNAGAIVRSAEAFGASGVLFLAGSVSPANPKTLRAAAGSLFRLPFATAPESEAVTQSERQGRRLLAASAHGGTPLGEASLERATIVVGSETHGVSPGLAAEAEAVVIPTQGVESLNAAAAVAVLLYEAERRRKTP